MELQDECDRNDTPRGVDFQMQHDTDHPDHHNLLEWLQQQNQLLNDTCVESLQRCKRDWLNERGESSKANQNSSFSNQCGPSRVTNDINLRTSQQDNGFYFNHNIPCIELDSDDEDEIQEFIDLTDTDFATCQTSSGNIDNLDFNGGTHSSLLSYYNIADVAGSLNQVATECSDDVISIHTDSDVLLLDVGPSDQISNEQVVDLLNNDEETITSDGGVCTLLNNDEEMITSEGGTCTLFNNDEEIITSDGGMCTLLNNDEEMITPEGGMCTSILSEFNIVDTEGHASVEEIETHEKSDLDDHLFSSILSPFSISNNLDDTKLETSVEVLPEDVTNSLLSTVSIEICDLTTETSQSKKAKKKRKKKTKKKKPTPPAHIIQKIIREKREKNRLRKKMKAEIAEEKKKIEIKKIKKEEVKKEESKVENVCEEVSPATVETTEVSRTIPTQTVKVFRIAIKDESEGIKEEKKED